jgi:hypothetical protein
MGLKDSSSTRVNPAFTALIASDPTGALWLPRLLTLPQHGHPQATNSSSLDLTIKDQKDIAWTNGGDRQEKALAPPVSLLSWLVRNVAAPAKLPKASEDTQEFRRKLLLRDSATVAQALHLLRSSASSTGWYIFEGLTYPDVYIETPDALIVIEGKRTEAGPTTHTTWMPARHQMLRHIDAAWEVRGSRQVFGFFIVEGDNNGDVPEKWKAASLETVSLPAIDGSLPHRSPDDREGIAKAFCGVTTWQQVCQTFGVP